MGLDLEIQLLEGDRYWVIEERKVENPLPFDLLFTALNNKKNFDLTFKDPDVKINSGPFSILVKFSEHKNNSLGMIIQKKNIKLAVQRNYVKRVVRNEVKFLSSKKPITIVFLVRKKIDHFNKHKLKKAIKEILSVTQSKL